MIGDTITVLRARRGRRLAKLLSPAGITDYDDAFSFDIFEQSVADLAALHQLLRALLGRPDCAVVRAALADCWHSTNVRRLLHPDQQTGDPPTLRDMARRWLALDVDNVARPAKTPPEDLAACAALALDRLPAVFRSTSHIVQATSGHRLKPGIRLRLWFWLDRPVWGKELKHWLRGAPVDRAVFSAAQLIYTAAPLFADGMTDHLSRRLLDVCGKVETVSVPSGSDLTPVLTTRRAPSAARRSTGTGGRYAFAALRSATARIATAAEGDRHATVLRAACSLARLVSDGLLTEREVRTALGGALQLAGKTAPEADAVWRWAMDHSFASSHP